MKKIVIRAPGGYEKLEIADCAEQEPGENEVRVINHAAGINYADVCVRWGVYESAKKYIGWPITPGFEFSGVIDKVGHGVSTFKSGDRVLGFSFFNGYSQRIVVPAENLLPLPASWDFKDGASVPAVFLTAFHACFQAAQVRPGSTVLIHSAAGGVGTALLQVCHLLGCKTLAVVGSSHKVSHAKEFGAGDVIDKSVENLWQKVDQLAPQGLDYVFDANGSETFAPGFTRLRPMGRLIVYGMHGILPKLGGKLNLFKAGWGLWRMPKFNPSSMITLNRGVIGFNISFLFDQRLIKAEATEVLRRWISEKKIRPIPTTCFAYTEVAKAHQLIESGMSVGKIILTFS